MPSLLTQSIFSGGIVNLSVGEEAVPFDAHIELLCSKSPFFDKALEDRFEETDTKHLELPNDDPKIFTNFLSWVYSGHFALEDSVPSWMELCVFWVMAEKFQIPELQNRVMERLIAKYKAMPETRKGNIHPLVVNYVYDNVDSTSPLRKIVLDICVMGMDIDKFIQHKQDYPKEFLEDFAIEQARKARIPPGYQSPLLHGVSKYTVEVEGNNDDVIEGRETPVQVTMPHRPKLSPRIARKASRESRSSSSRTPSGRRVVVRLPSAAEPSSSPSLTAQTPTPATSPSPSKVATSSPSFNL